MSIDDVALRPVAEADLPVMERFSTDPERAIGCSTSNSSVNAVDNPMAAILRRPSAVV